jgi:hypothetical protein
MWSLRTKEFEEHRLGIYGRAEKERETCDCAKKKKMKRDANVAEKDFQKRVRRGLGGLGANPNGVIDQFSLINVIFTPH